MGGKGRSCGTGIKPMGIRGLGGLACCVRSVTWLEDASPAEVVLV
jgi:hypothetical protein